MAGALGGKSKRGFTTDGKRPKVFGTVVSFTYNNK
ncbi:Uncharacterised protein [Pseudomonas fluorescens]|uniref:Uncharacterized protein n=1 Tax=Pseudomonas fluorescens TaxID=294 RepID=A0A3S4R9J8_PSEFL|nr:Uncharacterised protein [Pseudomonas fluorescens]